MTLQELYTAAVQDANRGQYAEAIRKLELILTHKIGAEDKANVSALLGSVYLQVGNNEQATRRLEEALAIAPNNAERWSNLSEGLRRLGRLDEAVEAARKALTLMPDYADAYYNMGNALNEQGKLNDAIASYHKALTLKPDYAEAYNNMGVALNEQGKLDDAIASYRKALTLKPDYAEVYTNMGVPLLGQGKLNDAIASYSKALTLKPDYADAYYNMGAALRGIKFTRPVPGMPEIICKILEKENLARPNDVAQAAISLLAFNPIIQDVLKKCTEGKLEESLQEIILDLSGIRLLLKLMEVCPIPDLDLESALKDIRYAILLNVSLFKNNSEILPFQISLALQCFTNEYLYDATEIEIKYLKELENLVENKLTKGQQPTPNELACLASYKAFYEYPWAHSLSMPVELKALQCRQILELKEEEQLRSKIPVLKGITDNVSSKVREQYEQHPYPRWTNLRLEISPRSISKIAQELDLKIPNPRINKVNSPQLLIAGCGTGQHSIGSASRFNDCDVLAIDLSLSSLVYAKRKTEELGFSNIEYMQADILDIGALNRKFDIIESAGVLHHMGDPMAGWKVLADCLNTGGLMNIGLYSDSARQHIVKIRDEIKKSNIDSSDDAMRSFRNHIVSSKKEHRKLIISSSDFYSMSTFRDLLFHVQEHRFSIPQIKDCLERLGLIFCGFEHHNMSLISKEFSKNDVYCLDKWDEYEKDNPGTFAEMYQFWCQKV